MPRRSRLIVGPAIALALATNVSACRRAPRIEAVADEQGDASASATTAWRCPPFVATPYANPDFDLLGMGWWSWEAGGSFEAGDTFDVRVVVHHGRPLEEIEKRYPTIEKKSDYRLVERDVALRYLDFQIADLRQSMAEDEESDFRELIAQLAQTRKTIVDCLGGDGGE